MDIVFTKISDARHAVEVSRTDGSSERIELDTRSFLRHDLAHLAIESEIPIKSGYWGCVAAGASLSGDGINGDEIGLAESLAGQVQTLMRIEAETGSYLDVLERVSPNMASIELAERIHERVRQLRGLWRATPYGSDMQLVWSEQIP